jgi:hypothetical protein
VSHTPSLRRRLLVALAGAMLLFGAMGAAARAESYGELGHCAGELREGYKGCIFDRSKIGQHPRGEGVHKGRGRGASCSASRAKRRS